MSGRGRGSGVVEMCQDPQVLPVCGGHQRLPKRPKPSKANLNFAIFFRHLHLLCNHSSRSLVRAKVTSEAVFIPLSHGGDSSGSYAYPRGRLG